MSDTNRDDAERIARDHVAASDLFSMCEVVFQARTLAEVTQLGLCGPVLYGNLDASPASSWIVYVSDPQSFALKSSWIVVVSRTDGAVVYSGSGHDEG